VTAPAYPGHVRYPGSQTVHARHPSRRAPACAPLRETVTSPDRFVLTTAPVTCRRAACAAVRRAGQRGRS
jgi:hypothetical protein